MSRTLAVVLLFALPISPLSQQSGQTQDPAPIRDGTALQVLQSVVNSLGGIAALGGLADCHVRGEMRGSGADTGSESFNWEFAVMNGLVEFRLEDDAASGLNLLVSGHGSAANIVNGQVTELNRLPIEAFPPLQLPGLILLRALSDSRYSVTDPGPITVNGKTLLHLHTELASDSVMKQITAQDWYIDPVSGLPMRVEFNISGIIPDPRFGIQFASGMVNYSNFKSQNGILVPFVLDFYIDGKFDSTEAISQVTVNSGAKSSDFDVPGTNNE